MRITPQTADIIRATVKEILGESAVVSLFGSRADDNARGGDIDLFIQTEAPVAHRASAAARVVAALQMRLGDQKIDVVLVDPTTPPQPIHEVARKTGIRL